MDRRWRRCLIAMTRPRNLTFRLQPELDQAADGFGAAGLVILAAAQASIGVRRSGCRRTPTSVPLPVGGGPRRFFVITV